MNVKKIEIRELPKMYLAFVSLMGPQNLEPAYAKLIAWAVPKGFMTEPIKMVTIYHDSFKHTEPARVRMSACMALNAPMETSGEIGLTTIEPGKFIVGSFEIGLHEFQKSWTGLYNWMQENGFKKAHRYPFEIYHNNYKEHPEQKVIVDLCIPIE